MKLPPPWLSPSSVAFAAESSLKLSVSVLALGCAGQIAPLLPPRARENEPRESRRGATAASPFMAEKPCSGRLHVLPRVNTSTYVLVKLNNTLEVRHYFAKLSLLLRGRVRIKIGMVSLYRRSVGLFDLNKREAWR